MNEIVDNILTHIGNLILIGLLFYVVFWLHHSGWWFLTILVAHFKTHKQIEIDRKFKELERKYKQEENL